MRTRDAIVGAQGALVLAGSYATMLGQLACSTPAALEPRPVPDSAQFAAAIDRLQMMAGTKRLEVDPSPLLPDGIRTDTIGTGKTFRAVFRGRNAVLQSHHIPMIQRLSSGNCPGTLYPGKTQAAAILARKSCPALPTLLASVALARPIAADSSSTDQEHGGTPLDRVGMRVATIDLNAFGSTRVTYDFVLERENGLWKVVRETMVAILE